MQSTINILGVAGSMRSDSYSTKALKIALEYAKKYGADVFMLDLSKTVLPLRDPSAPASGQEEEVVKAVEWADAFMLASPDYPGSMSVRSRTFLTTITKILAASCLAISSHHMKRD
jgi:NAD(P)H-dependent FMN reductase